MASRHGDQGFTLAEMLITTALSLMLITAVFTVLLSVSQMLTKETSNGLVSDASVRAVDSMSMEIRQGVESISGQGVFLTTTASTCEFYEDVDGNGVADKVKFWYDATSGCIYRAQALATDSAVPFTWAAYPVRGTTVTDDVSPRVTPVFQYYQESTAGNAPVPSANATDTTMVLVTVRVQDPTGAASSEQSTLVRVRALQDVIY